MLVVGEVGWMWVVVIREHPNVFYIMYIFICNVLNYPLFIGTAYLGRHTELSSGCIIGAMCHVTSQEMLPENTVIYGEKCERRIQAEKPAVRYRGGGVVDFIKGRYMGEGYFGKINSLVQFICLRWFNHFDFSGQDEFQ